MSQEQEPQPISVSNVIVETLDFMSALAWQKLGLQPDMATGKLAPDLDQAKLAIDAVSALSEIILPQLDSEEDKRQVQNIVRDLRVNYVQRRQA